MRGMLFGVLFQPTHPGVKRIGRLMVPSLLGLSVTQINITVSTILGLVLLRRSDLFVLRHAADSVSPGDFRRGPCDRHPADTVCAGRTRRTRRVADDPRFRSANDFLHHPPGHAGADSACGNRSSTCSSSTDRSRGQDTVATATAVLCYAVGLWAFAGVRIIVSAYYSIQDTKTPAITAACAVAANIVFSLVLMRSLEAAGTGIGHGTGLHDERDHSRGAVEPPGGPRGLGLRGSIDCSRSDGLCAGGCGLLVGCGRRGVGARRRMDSQISHAFCGNRPECRRVSGHACPAPIRGTRCVLGDGETEIQTFGEEMQSYDMSHKASFHTAWGWMEMTTSEKGVTSIMLPRSNRKPNRKTVPDQVSPGNGTSVDALE